MRERESKKKGGERESQKGREGVRSSQGVEHERSCRTCCSHCSNINNGVLGTDVAVLVQTQTVEAAGLSRLWTGSVSLLLLLEAQLHLRV